MACLVLSLALVHLCKIRIYFTISHDLTELYGMVENGWNLRFCPKFFNNITRSSWLAIAA